MKYHFRVQKENSGFWAQCLELPGCKTQAENTEDLAANCTEALNLYLEEPGDSKMVFPLPNSSLEEQKDLLRVEVEPEIAFAVVLRFYRNSHKWTQQEVATKLGMKNLYSYQRLERRSNPTLHLIKKVKTVFPEITLESIV